MSLGKVRFYFPLLQLVDQLAPDGRLIIPVVDHIKGGQNLKLIDRTSDGKIKQKS